MSETEKEGLEIVTIVNTHAHSDHTAGNAELKTLTGAVIIHALDAAGYPMELPDHSIIWPGHNYGPTPSSTIRWEKRNNVNAEEYGYYVADD